MPTCLKSAVFSPLLKKPDADFLQFKNFRSISNLKARSKIVDKKVALQLNNHLMNNNLHENFQSAYKVHHSTETVKVKVHDDILQAIDGNRSVVLLMLDLSWHLILCLMKYYWIGCLDVIVLQGLYKNSSHPTCQFAHNLFKLNVQDILYENLIVVYRKGLSLGLCYMFCTLHQWLIS